MHKRLVVGTDIWIEDGCTITHCVHGSGVAEFVLTDDNETVDLEIESEALRVFVTEATAALAEMDRRFAEEEDARHPR